MASKVCCRLRVELFLCKEGGGGGGQGGQRLKVSPWGLYIQLHQAPYVTRDCERWWWAPRPCCSGTLHPVLCTQTFTLPSCVGEVDL